MEQRLSIIGLGVNDLKVSEHFYSQIFGWHKLAISNETIKFYQLNGLLLSLYPRDKLAEDALVSPKGDGFKALSIAYNTKSEKEVDDLFEYFKKNKVTIVKKPEHVFWGGYSGYIADPDNNLWEIAYNPFMQFDAKGNVVTEA